MKRESRREHNPVRASGDDGLEKAGRLAPPEEGAEIKKGASAGNDGVLAVDTGELKLPSEFTEQEDERARLFGLEPVALIILVFSLLFIAFIAYLIAAEPPK